MRKGRVAVNSPIIIKVHIATVRVVNGRNAMVEPLNLKRFTAAF